MADSDALIVNIVASQKEYERQMAQIVRQSERTARAAEKAFEGTGRNIGRNFQTAGKTAADGLRTAQFGAQNLSFQLNDLATQIASGGGFARPLAQQGGQIVQIFQQMGQAGVGFGAVLRSLVSGPNLFAIALTAAAGAAAYFFSESEGGAKKADAALKQHTETINALKEAYGAAAKGVQEFADRSKELALGMANIDAAVLRLEQKITTSEFFRGGIETAGGIDLTDLVTFDSVKLQAEMDRLNLIIENEMAAANAGLKQLDPKVISDAEARIAHLNTTLGAVAGGFAGLADLPVAFNEALMDLSESALDGSADFVTFQNTIAKLTETVPNLTDEQRKLVGQLIELAEAGAKQQRALEAVEKAQVTVTTSAKEMLTVLGQLAAAWTGGFGPGVLQAIEAVLQKLGSVNEAIRQIMGTISGIGGMFGEAWEKSGKAIKSTTDLIKQRESFRSQAYWDVNAYRVGFGSDTYVDEMGKIQKVTKDTVVTVRQAEQDLARRIGEFQSVIVGQIGAQTWTDLSEKQQAALTDIAYNYGKLPNSIVRAIQQGDSGQVARAIQALGSDNAGINRGRREQEAQLYAEGGAFSDAALKVGELTEAQRAENEEERKRLELSGDLTDAFDQETYKRVYAAELSEKMAKAEADARERGAALTEQEIALIKQQAEEKAKLAAQEAGAKKVREGEKDVEARIEAMRNENAELEKRAELMGTSLEALEASLSAEEQAAALRDAQVKALEIENGFKEQGIALTKQQTDAILQQQQALALGKAGLKGFDTQTKELKSSIEDFNQQMAGVFKSAISGFISDLRNGMDAGEAFSRMLDRIVDGLIDMALNMLFSKNLLGGLFGGGGGLFGGGMGAGLFEKGGKVGGPPGVGRPMRNANPAWWIGAPSFARGGPVLPYGAVPILAHAGETVLPKGAKVGGGNVTNHVGGINIDMSSTGLAASSTEQGKLLGRQIQAAVQVVLVQESRPGGILRRTP